MVQSPAQKGRRKLLWGVFSLLLSWPLLQFARFMVPAKPVQVKVTDPLSAGGVIMQKEFILFDRGGKCWALSRKCTHLGCSVNYQETEDLLECPCHQSRFQVDSGAVIRGPASRPLPLLQVEKSSTDNGYVVTIKG